jgi:post-segregation antitoxin (ccd killing protein)
VTSSPNNAGEDLMLVTGDTDLAATARAIGIAVSAAGA